MQILRAADHKRMPWKNGGGETTEIAVFPENAGLSDFDWRVSMARVDGDGPFSIFPGIDRTLAILEGAGIVLSVEGSEPMRLTLDSEPHAFPADIATSARRIAGTVIDFNVMSRRGMIEHKVDRLKSRCLSPAGLARLVHCASGSVAINSAGVQDMLGPKDAAVLLPDEAVDLAPGPGGEFYLVVFQPA